MTLAETIRRALDAGIISEPPYDRAATLILIDSRGCVVSQPMTEEFLEDAATDPDLQAAAFDSLLQARARVYRGLPE